MSAQIEMESYFLQLSSKIPLEGPVEETEKSIRIAPRPDDDDPFLNPEGQFTVLLLDRWTPKGLERPAIRLPADWRAFSLTLKDLCSLLSSLPDVRTFKSVTAINYYHPAEYKQREEHKQDTLMLPAKLDNDANLILYCPDDLQVSKSAIWHLYATQLRSDYGDISQAFDSYNSVYPLILLHKGKEVVLPEVAWQILSEKLFADEISEGLIIAHSNTVLVTLWAKALSQHLSKIPQEIRGASYEKCIEICEHLLGPVKEKALERLIADDSYESKECLRIINS